MPDDTNGPVLKMLDLTLREFDDLYYGNEKLFRSVNNWFYFANDKKLSSLSAKGYVCYGRNRGRTRSYGFPEDDFGALVLLCRSDGMDMDSVRAKCDVEKNGLVHFELTDGTPAHYGIIRDTIGVWGPVGSEHVLLMIPNKPQTISWPYSLKGNTSYDKASEEEGTITYHAESGMIGKLLPEHIKKDLGI